MLGIDEAGRGPVLAALVYGAAWTTVEHAAELKALGYDDSKQLKEGARAAFFDNLAAGTTGDDVRVAWKVHVSGPEDISNRMLRVTREDLNTLSHNAAIWLVRFALDQDVNVQEVYVDTVGDPDKYADKLRGVFPGIGKVVVEKKADATYPIVSAASICAKVTRDRLLEAWQFREPPTVAAAFSRAFGSGYPGDAVTKRWLLAHMEPVFGAPSIVRFSWKTMTTLLEQHAVPVTFAADEDEADEEPAKKRARDERQQRLWSERYRFFAQNNISLVNGVDQL